MCLVGSNPTLSARCNPRAADAALSPGKCPRARSAPTPERCWSGRSGTPGKRVGAQVPRGFESHPLRHTRPALVPRPHLRHTRACRGYPAAPPPKLRAPAPSRPREKAPSHPRTMRSVIPALAAGIPPSRPPSPVPPRPSPVTPAQKSSVTPARESPVIPARESPVIPALAAGIPPSRPPSPVPTSPPSRKTALRHPTTSTNSLRPTKTYQT